MGCQGSKLDEQIKQKQFLNESVSSQSYLKPTFVATSNKRKEEDVEAGLKVDDRSRNPKYRTKIDSRVVAKYEIRALIGKGSFSDVLRVEKKTTKEPFAIKVIKTSAPNEMNQLQLELSVLVNVQHPFIMQLEEVIFSKDCTYLVMELATGGELYDRIKSRGHLDEKDSVRILQMVLEGVDYLHARGITHRDLKPENLLFYHPGNDSKILITDFGFAKSRADPTDPSPLTTWCGTPEYIAPELVSKEPYTNKVDLWAIGVITYVMLSGHLPFASDSPAKLFQKILQGAYTFSQEVWKMVTADAQDFIGKLLVVNPSQRFDAVQALKHPFVKSVPPVNKHNHRLASQITRTTKSQRSKINSSSKTPRDESDFHLVSNIVHADADSPVAPPISAAGDHSEQSQLTSDVISDRLKVKYKSYKRHSVASLSERSSKGGLVLPYSAGNFMSAFLTKDRVLQDNLSSISPSNAEEFPSAAATEDTNSVQSSGQPYRFVNGKAEIDEAAFSFPASSHFDPSHFKLPSSQELRKLQYANGTADQTHRTSGLKIHALGDQYRSIDEETITDPSEFERPHHHRRWSHTQPEAIGRSNLVVDSVQDRPSGYIEKVGGWLNEQHGTSRFSNDTDSSRAALMETTLTAVPSTVGSDLQEESVHVTNETRSWHTKPGSTSANSQLIALLQTSQKSKRTSSREQGFPLSKLASNNSDSPLIGNGSPQPTGFFPTLNSRTKLERDALF